MNATATTPIDPRAHIPWLDWQRGYMRWTCEIDGLTVEIDDVGIQMTRYHREGQVTFALSTAVVDLGAAMRARIPPDIDAESQRADAETYMLRTWRSVLREVSDV